MTYIADSASPGFQLKRGGRVVRVPQILPGVPELAADITNLVQVGGLWIGEGNGSFCQLQDVLHGRPNRELEVGGLFVRDGLELTWVIAARGGGEEAEVLVLVAVELIADGAVETRHDVVDIGIVITALSRGCGSILNGAPE